MDQRKEIFERNVGIIRDVNAAFDNGESSYELRVNCFGDLELEEFAREYLGLGVLSMLWFFVWKKHRFYDRRGRNPCGWRRDPAPCELCKQTGLLPSPILSRLG